MYRHSAEGTAYMGIGGSATDFVAISEITGTQITHNTPQPRQPPGSMESKLPAQQQRAGRLSVGQAQYQLIADESNEAVLDAEKAAKARALRYFREELGDTDVETLVDNTANVTVEIDASAKTMQLAGTATPTIATTFGTTLAPNSPWDVGLVVEIAGVAYKIGRWEDGSDTCRISRLGTAASGVVTLDDVALADVAATPAWKLHAWGTRYDFHGPVTGAPGHSADGTSVTKTVTAQLQVFETKSFLIGS